MRLAARAQDSVVVTVKLIKCVQFGLLGDNLELVYSLEFRISLSIIATPLLRIVNWVLGGSAVYVDKYFSIYNTCILYGNAGTGSHSYT